MGGGAGKVAVLRDGRGWGVEVEVGEGRVRRYRYGSEAQARYFAAVFSLGPRVLPPSRRGGARGPKGRRAVGRAARRG